MVSSIDAWKWKTHSIKVAIALIWTHVPFALQMSGERVRVYRKLWQSINKTLINQWKFDAAHLNFTTNTAASKWIFSLHNTNPLSFIITKRQCVVASVNFIASLPAILFRWHWERNKENGKRRRGPDEHRTHGMPSQNSGNKILSICLVYIAIGFQYSQFVLRLR